MKAIVEINLNSPQAMSLMGYLESLPFAKVKKEKAKARTALQQAIDEGAISLEEASVRFEDKIRKAYEV